MALAKQNMQHTINEIYALPDGQRAELIDGDVYSFTDNIPCSIYDGFKIDFSKITIE